jgi:hypothetical protein
LLVTKQDQPAAAVAPSSSHAARPPAWRLALLPSSKATTAAVSRTTHAAAAAAAGSCQEASTWQPEPSTAGHASHRVNRARQQYAGARCAQRSCSSSRRAQIPELSGIP